MQKKTRRNAIDITQNNTPQLLLYTIQQLSNQRDAALVAFIYLTGCRISEILGKKKVIPIYEGKGKERLKVSAKEVIILPLKYEDVVQFNEEIILIQNIPCLKYRNTVPRRNTPLKLNSADDKPFIDIFMSYYRTLQPGATLFDMSRQRAWQIVNKKLGVFTHYLIHERCTELVTKRGLTDLYLKQLRGWKDTRPAGIYAHLNWQDLAEKL